MRVIIGILIFSTILIAAFTPAIAVSEVESNLTQIESMLNENEESYSTEVKDSVFD